MVAEVVVDVDYGISSLGGQVSRSQHHLTTRCRGQGKRCSITEYDAPYHILER